VTRRTFTWSPIDERAVAVLAIIVSLAMVPLLTRNTGSGSATADIAVRVLGVVLLYVGWHAGAAQLMPAQGEASNAVGWVLVGLGFVGLFAVKATLQLFPHGRFARNIHPWLFAGLYLDERFTRLTFRVWPPRLLRRSESPRTINIQATLEART
jgi:NAD(P)H-quinone oxidoreductase subunit 5